MKHSRCLLDVRSYRILLLLIVKNEALSDLNLLANVYKNIFNIDCAPTTIIVLNLMISLFQYS